jgi:ABC-type Na+ efflux pump permease subunit
MVGGGIWPVVHRELRAGARRPLNHWLRVLAVIVGVIGLHVAATNAPITTVGNRIFVELHRLLMFLILCVVPAITADCIARERREGTLGLLFMTPLRSWEIVIGKAAVQVLKAFTLWLAVVPILTIPFLSGGITWGLVAVQLGAELCAGIFCLAAGILATSLTDKRALAFILAFAFAATLVFGLTDQQFWGALPWTPGIPTIVLPSVPTPAAQSMLIRRMVLTRLPGGGTGYAFTMQPMVVGPAPAPAAVISLWPTGGRILFALVVLWAAIRFAGFCVERSWKDKIPSMRQIKWEKFCGTPLSRQWSKRKMRETLEWNPIAWLQQYSWKARLTKWGLCLVFTALLCIASTADTFQEISEREVTVVIILAAAYTYAGVNGFLQEKKNGALELILVTPLSIDEIIFGRMWGLWKQYFPATALLAGCYYALGFMWPHGDNWQTNYSGPRFTDESLQQVGLILAFFALPFYATLAALLFRNLVVAACLTWLALVAAPIIGISIMLVLAITLELTGSFWFCLGALGGHAVFARIAFKNLRRRLTQRDFAF